jgi:hypothetical protein
MAAMTQAQWVASVPPQGTLTLAMCPNLVAQALSDGDNACALTVETAGVPPAALGARADLFALFSYYTTAALADPGGVLSTPARTALINAGTSYYSTSGAP